jgi:hypothetical protein
MIDKLIKKYETLLNTLRENKKIADGTDFYPYNVDIKNTREYLKDLKALKQQLTLTDVVKPFYCANKQEDFLEDCKSQCEECRLEVCELK